MVLLEILLALRRIPAIFNSHKFLKLSNFSANFYENLGPKTVFQTENKVS